MAKTLNEVKLDGKKQQLELILKQLEDLYGKLAVDRSGSRSLIEAEIEQLEKKATELEEIIQNLETEVSRSSPSSAQVELTPEQQKQFVRTTENFWEQDLHKIDYRKAKQQIHAQLKCIDVQAGNVLFLFKNAESLKGDLCVRYLQAEFSNSCGTRLYSLEVNFESVRSPTIDLFTTKLAQRLNIHADSCENRFQQSFSCLENILSASSGLFLKMEIQSRVDANNEFLPWFLNTFWDALKHCLSKVRQKRPDLSVVVVVAISGSLPASLQQQVCCSGQAQLPAKFLDLPLEEWSVEDITRWLDRFSGLGLHYSQCCEIAEAVYDAARGNPAITYTRLCKELAGWAS